MQNRLASSSLRKLLLSKYSLISGSPFGTLILFLSVSTTCNNLSLISITFSVRRVKTGSLLRIFLAPRSKLRKLFVVTVVGNYKEVVSSIGKHNLLHEIFNYHKSLELCQCIHSSFIKGALMRKEPCSHTIYFYILPFYCWNEIYQPISE